MTKHDTLEWTRLGDVAIKILDIQCQYASQYIYEPEFSWVRWEERCAGDYHSIYIRTEDVPLFVKQVKKIRG